MNARGWRGKDGSETMLIMLRSPTASGDELFVWTNMGCWIRLSIEPDEDVSEIADGLVTSWDLTEMEATLLEAYVMAVAS